MSNGLSGDLAGRTAFVTGGASGIGFGLAQAFVAAGMNVAIADVDQAALDAAAVQLSGVRATCVALDVTDRLAFAAAAARVEAELGPVDVLCNNAGIGQGRHPSGRPFGILEITPEAWRLVLDINLNGVFNGVGVFAPGMVERGRGHIVNTASMAGMIAPAGLGAYSASKFAVVGLSESLRAELAPTGVGVSVLCPGGVRSNLVATSAARRAVSLRDPPASAARGTAAPGVPRMDAVKVGERVLAAIRADEMHIFTHPEYEPLMEARFAAVRAAIGASAQPGYRDDDGLLGASSNPEYSKKAKRHG